MLPDDKLNKMSLNEQFLRQIFANQKRIYAFIAMLVPGATDVEDIMQETLLTMWRKFEDFEPETDFTAWGIRIARYKVMEFRRKSSHRYIHFSDKAFENIVSRTDKVIDGMDDRIQALQNCLAKLGERERHLVRIRYEQDITTRSLAERIGEPVDRLYKVMARIHDSLQKCVRRTLAAWEMAR